MIWLFESSDYGRAVATVAKIVPDDGERNFAGYARVYDNQSNIGLITDYVITGGVIKPRITITSLSPDNFSSYTTIPVYVSATGYPFRLYYTGSANGYLTITGAGTYYLNDLYEDASVLFYSDPDVTWRVEARGYTSYYDDSD